MNEINRIIMRRYHAKSHTIPPFINPKKMKKHWNKNLPVSLVNYYVPYPAIRHPARVANFQKSVISKD